jgi:hypothetical protein
MSNNGLSISKANLDLTLIQAEANSVKDSDLFILLMDLGLSPNAALKLRELIYVTRKIGAKVINIGKIIVLKILAFIKAHPFLVLGTGIGLMIGAAVTALITSIPFVGQLLAPLATALGIAITVRGALIGHNLDKQGVGQDIVDIANEFFSLFISIFQTVSSQFAS